MMRGFWGTLKKPIFALAPMANVTDEAFRRVIVKYGKPDVMWTEFVSVEGLLSRGREKLLVDLWFMPAERPIVAQIFGGKPEQFYEVAQLCAKLGFDGIDINMGCPVDEIVKSGGGACLIKDPQLAQRVITETLRGIKDAGSTIPVSVKTRLGYNTNEMETWLPALLTTGIAALTVHLRMRKEMSKVPAHWELARRIVELRDKHSPETLLLGNGDLISIFDARVKVAESGMDGAMLGRAIFGNPWLFVEKIPTTEEKLRACVEHTKLFEELFGAGSASRFAPSVIASLPTGQAGTRSKPALSLLARLKPFDVMKKHFKAYVNGFDGAKELRGKMMEAENVDQIEKSVLEFLQTNT